MAGEDGTTGPDRILASLAEEYWQARLANEPLAATALGDRRFDDRLPDITPDGILRAERQYRSILERCERLGDEGASEAARLTSTALKVELGAQLDYIACRLENWTVDPLDGPQVQLQNVESYQPIRTTEQAAAMVRRWRAIGPLMDAHMANLRSGASGGRFAVVSGMEKVLEEIDDYLAKPNDDSPFLRPLRIPHEDWSPDEMMAFRTGLSAATSEVIRPAFTAYRTLLKSELLPNARTQERPGLMHVPGGVESYSRLIRYHTSLDLTPDELHQTGLREVERINGEMENLGEKVFGVRERAQILRRLRTDASLYFANRDEVAEKAERALSRAASAIPKWFGRLPKADCQVVRMGAHEEKHSTIAYYRPPAADGSRPGTYYINTSAPETRPKYEAEVLAYHESIPGHHLQIAIAQELEGIPDFRRHSGVTAFIEGWGLYTERLSDEMGLYSSDLDRIGVLSYDSWRACRLVVDTGMHAKGWTREQAIKFMLENTALAENNIVNEVDRYISWPAQALAYKTGQLEIRRLRKEAELRLGASFDIRKFHDRVLKNGAVPLSALRTLVETMDR